MKIDKVVEHVLHLPADWHGAGSLKPNVLRAIVRQAQSIDIKHSVETGSGKSTLLLSHLSPDHAVFAMDDGNGSVQRVRESELLCAETVRFVEGPTQRTLLRQTFDEPLQLVLLDGPHGYPFHHLEYYCVYPHIEFGGLLIVDDIDIPSVYDMYRFLKRDEMFELSQVVHTTAFFRRTNASVFDPFADGWWLQNYNRRKKLVDWHPLSIAMALVPRSTRRVLLRMVRKQVM